MVSICFYFQVHQPYRLRRYSVFDIGNNTNYFDEQKNAQVMRKVADKCYIPTNRVLLDLIKQHNGKFKVSFSISGTALDQFEHYAPDVLESFKELAKTGCVEFMDETYFHSLSYLYDKDEFRQQVLMHRQRIKELFDQEPTAFRNTELIYNNELANYIQSLGYYNAIVAEGADHVMGWKSPNFIYTPKTADKMSLLLKNYKLSDDIAFRFSNKDWAEYPLDAGRFAHWVSQVNGNGNVINLFMDYETFGEHQWADTGIFEFLRHMPSEVFRHPDNNFVTVSEAAKLYPKVAEMDIHNFISWADLERDLSAWLGNPMQDNAAKELYRLGALAKQTGDASIIADWRKLTTSDHLYYMCTKWFSDGDVHKYFNPYDSPYEGFIAFMNVLNDLAIRVRESLRKKQEEQAAVKLLTDSSSSMTIGEDAKPIIINEGMSKSVQRIITESPSVILNDYNDFNSYNKIN